MTIYNHWCDVKFFSRIDTPSTQQPRWSMGLPIKESPTHQLFRLTAFHNFLAPPYPGQRAVRSPDSRRCIPSTAQNGFSRMRYQRWVKELKGLSKTARQESFLNQRMGIDETPKNTQTTAKPKESTSHRRTNTFQNRNYPPQQDEKPPVTKTWVPWQFSLNSPTSSRASCTLGKTWIMANASSLAQTSAKDFRTVRLATAAESLLWFTSSGASS